MNLKSTLKKKVAKPLSEPGTKIDKKTSPIENDASSSESEDETEESSSSSSSEEEIQKRNGSKVVTKNGVKNKSKKSGSSSEVSNDSSDEESDSDSENQTIATEENKSSSSSDDSSDSSDDESEKKNNKKEIKNTGSEKPGENTDSSSSESEESSENEIIETKVNNGVNKDSLNETSDSSSSEEESSDSVEDSGIAETKVNNGVNKNSFISSDSSSSEEEVSDSAEDSKVQNISNNQGQNSSDSSSSSGDTEEENEDTAMDIENSNNNPTVESSPSKRKLDNSNFNSFKKTKVNEDSSECKTVFVGNLSFNVDDNWLRQEFEEAGEIVDVRIIYDKDTGKSRGFGYVEFATTEGANNAMKFAGGEIDGRAINVDLAGQKTGSFKKKSNLSRGTSEVSNTIFVGNLSFNVTEDEIWETFGNYGQIVAVRIPTHEDTGKLKGYGYVEFADTNAAQKAMELHGTEIGGRAVRLDFSEGKRDNGSNFGNRRGRGGKSRGGFDNKRGRGGRGGFSRGGFNKSAAANRGAIAPPQGRKITFD